MRWLAFPLLFAVAACTPGPRNLDAGASAPPPPPAQSFRPASGPAQATDLAVVAPDWWRTFANPDLDALVAEALRHSTDLAIADAALRQAGEQARVIGATRLPQVDANYTAQRARVTNTLAPAVTDASQYLYTLHTAQVTVAYPLDLFGGTRARTRSARAAAQVARHRLEAARSTLVATLVQAVIQHASLADQMAAAQTSIAVNRDILAALTRRQQLGAVGAADVATQAAALAAAEAVLPALDRAEAHQRVVIGTLLGRAAGNVLPPLPALSALSLPRDLPLVVPSELVARRPDVRAAGAQVEGAGADLGVAIAARLPAIQLSAQAGGEAQNLSDLFTHGNLFFSVLGGVTQPIFHAGALRYQQRAAQAALEGTKAQYRGAVLQAFGDVSDALTALRTDADALDAANRGSAAAGRALTFIRRQLALGDVGTLALLNATAADAQAQSLLVQARAARLTDTVALFQAAGGGVVGN